METARSKQSPRRQLGQMLHDQRAGRTYAEVARILGVAYPRTIKRWEEAEDRIQPRWWPTVATFLGISTEEVARLLGEKGDPVVRQLRVHPRDTPDESPIPASDERARYKALLFEGLEGEKAENPAWTAAAKALGQIIGEPW